MMKRVFVIMFWGLTAFGYPLSHGPFEVYEKPKAFPLTRCKEVEQTKSGADGTVTNRKYAGLGRNAPRMRLSLSSAPDGIMLTILDRNGNTMAGPLRIIDFAIWIYLGKTYCSDLNGDGKVDFIVEISYGGCGLAAGYSNLGIALSRFIG